MPSLRRSTNTVTLSPHRSTVRSLGHRGRALLRTAPLLRRSTTLSLYRLIAPPLGRSVAVEEPCSAPHCCRDRSVQSGERRLQSGERRLQSRERRLQSRDYRSVTLSLCGPAAPSLRCSVAGEVPCSVPHCCRDRSVQSGERCVRSGSEAETEAQQTRN